VFAGGDNFEQDLISERIKIALAQVGYSGSFVVKPPIIDWRSHFARIA
jgi:hypothetical protein